MHYLRRPLRPLGAPTDRGGRPGAAAGVLPAGAADLAHEAVGAAVPRGTHAHDLHQHHLAATCRSINTLNHYVGMKRDHARRLPASSATCRRRSPCSACSRCSRRSFNRRWLAMLGWLAFTGVRGLHVHGLRALAVAATATTWTRARAIKLPLFTPPLIGFKQMANFQVLSMPGPGTVLLGRRLAAGPDRDLARDARGAPRPGDPAKSA